VCGASGQCERCGLVHGPDELFVAVEHEVLVETCELEAARNAAHSVPQPDGALAYHATHPTRLDSILARGLDPDRCARPDCKHVALAQTPGIAAGVLSPKEDGVPYVVDGIPAPVVLQVDVRGLHLFFEFGEARHHGTVIESSRLRAMDPQPAPDVTGWSDPAWRRDHSDCLVLNDLPLSRRLLNTATDEFNKRYPYGADHGAWRQVVAEFVRAAQRSAR
jgi:hypothetical protein